MILLFGKDQVLCEPPRMSCCLLTMPYPSGRPAVNLPLSPQLYHSTCGRGSPNPSLSTNEGVQPPPLSTNAWCLSRALRQKAMPLTLTGLIPCYCPTLVSGQHQDLLLVLRTALFHPATPLHQILLPLIDSKRVGCSSLKEGRKTQASWIPLVAA